MAVSPTYSVEEYESLLVALQNTFGIVVPEEHRGMMVERLLPLLPQLGVDTLSALAARLGNGDSGSIGPRVLDELSRYSAGWHLSAELRTLLRDYVFDELADGSRIWLVGCGDGTVAWSIAMELDDFEHQHERTTRIQIVATDSSAENVERASLGSYDEISLSVLSEELCKHYFAREEGTRLAVKDRLRSRVDFQQCDLATGCERLGLFDVIICPDVLSYFSNGGRSKVLERFKTMLKAGGMLLPGSSQIIPPSAGLERVDHPAGVFYRQRS